MKKLSLIIMAALTLASCCNKNPFLTEWDTPYGIPPFEQIKTCHYMPALEQGIKEQLAEVDAIIACPEAPTFENTILALDQSGALSDKVVGVMFNLAETDGTPELLDLVEQASGLLSDLSNTIYMNEDLFKRVDAVYKNMDGLTREQQMVTSLIHLQFIQNGVGLEPAQRERIAQINTRLAELHQKFGRNLLNETNAMNAELGIMTGGYPFFMSTTTDRALREKAFRLYSNRGNNGNENDNNLIILEIMRLRIEHAHLLGYETPADEILADKMAKTPQAVDTFLKGIMDKAMARAKEEKAILQAAMNDDIAAGLLPKGSTIEPWDWFYYANKVQVRDYAINDEDVKPYFAMENVRAGVFGMASKLYGIKMEKLENAPKYYKEVEVFKITDADDSLIGIFLSDYFPRDTKRGGAWMNNIVGANGVKGVRPVIVNVGNFSRPEGDKPGLLTTDEVETMFHEFGHALHGLLTQTTYRTVSGTSVARDFVELPSQIHENWAFQPEVLATYAKHYATGEVIPAELVAKIDAASKWNTGFVTGELTAASILDMKWHEISSINCLQAATVDEARAIVEGFEKKFMREAGLIDEIIPRYRATYFNHIFNNGYNAGYYSYEWAEVLDKDAFHLFVEKGIFDHETAMSFRRNILEAGYSEEPMVLYKRFRGADPDPKWLYEGRGL